MNQATVKKSERESAADLLSVSACRKLAGCSAQTVRRWINDGVIDRDGWTKTASGRYRVYRWAIREAAGLD